MGGIKESSNVGAAGFAWPVAALALVLGVLLHASLFTGLGLVPADGVLSALPWARSFHARPTNYLLSDQYATFLPVRQFLFNELRQGRFPLWNPHLACGVPSLASMQIAVFYPLNVLLAPLGPFTASGIAAFLKLLLAGVFTMLYLRRMGLSPAAGLAAAIVYALSGFMIVWLGHPHVNAAVLLPLLLYFVETQFAGPPRLRPWIGFACAYAAMLLGGHPPTAFHITVVVALYFGFRLAEPGCQERLRRTGLWLAATLAGAAIAAPQLLPYVEYYRESSSALATASLDRWASHLTPATLPHLLLPYLSGAPHLGFEQLASGLGLGAIVNFSERTGYVGVFTLFLVTVGLVRRPSRVALFYAGLAAASLLIVYGVPPFPAVMHALPIASGVNHQRLLLMVDFSAAVLAGFGLDSLLRADPGRRVGVLAVAFAVAIAVALALVWNVIGAGFAVIDGASRAFLLRQLWIPAGGIVAAFLLIPKRLAPPVVATIAVAWIAVDLLWFATGFNPAIPLSQYYPTTDSIRMLESDPSRFRVIGLSKVLVPNTAAVYGLDDARGQDFTTLRRYEELITGRAGDFFFYKGGDRLPPSFPLLNVKYILAPTPLAVVPDGFELVYDGDIAIYRYARAADRALIVTDYEVARSSAAILERVRSGSFDPSKTVLLEEPPAAVAGATDPTVSSAEARIVAYEPDRVVIQARLPRPGFLLLLDNDYPGWHAFAGRRELPIHRADYSFRAVALPSGTMTVEFVYRPLSFRLGAVLSLLTMGVLAVLWLRESRMGSRERRAAVRDR